MLFPFFRSQAVFDVGQVDVARFDVAQERCRRHDEGDFRSIEDFFPRDAEALDGKGLFRRYGFADVVEDFVRKEEFKADGQVEEEFRCCIEGRAIAEFFQSQRADRRHERFLFSSVETEFFINITD